MISHNVYADLEIRILKRLAQGSPVEIALNHEQESSRGYLDPGFLSWVPTVQFFTWLT